MPMESVGATSAPVSSPTAFASTSGQSASVPMKPFGPCCSVEPMGIMMAVELLR